MGETVGINKSNRACCIIPGLHSSDCCTAKSADGDSNTDCQYVSADRKSRKSNSSNIAVRSGPLGRHAVATQDMNAGTLVVQCLPLAHSILQVQEEERDGDDDGSKLRRCARCFIQEGDNDPSGLRRGSFGRCSKCQSTYYCTRSCQAADWEEQHKLECQYFMKLKKSNKSPSFYTKSPEEDSLPLLLRTFNSLKCLQLRPADDDDTPTKNADATEIDSEQDESLFVSCGPRHFSSLVVSPEYNDPSPSAATFDGSGIKIAKEVMKSSAARELPKCTTNETAGKIDEAVLRIFGYSEISATNNQGASDSTTDWAIRRTLNAYQKNNFGIVNSLHSTIGEGVYPAAALLNHSCFPNCILRYKLGTISSNNGKQQFHPPILQIIACRDISFGEELTHSYVDLALCTQERQARLSQNHGFVCQCQRCEVGGCTLRLPKDKKKWDLWPLEMEFQSFERNEANLENATNLVQVDLDDAMTQCHGLGKGDMMQITKQSEIFRGKSVEAMVEGDVLGELRYLRSAIELYTSGRGCGKWITPFHGQLYSVRCAYFSALLANGQINEAVEQCEHIVSFLMVAFSQVQHHPLLGLQLYTLGDLYASAAGGGHLATATEIMSKKSKQAHTLALRRMRITHGESDQMVQALHIKLRPS